MASDLEPDVTLPWLVRFRWLFVAGQAVALGLAWRLELALAWPLAAVAVTVGAASNLALHAALARRPWRWPPARVMGGVMILDTALLTMLLAATGGATNPFTVLYLVHITLSAVVLSARWTTAIALLSVVGFASLFLLPGPAADPHAGHHAGHAGHAPPEGFSLHLQGMWAAFVLAAGLTAYFIRRISRAIASQREQIAALREAAARNARLAALTTLAAGAAHELGSPLATIAVAAHEAGLGVGRLDGGGEVADDLRLIQLEVERCQDILHQMAARASEAEAAVAIPLAGLEARIREQLGDDRSRRVDVRAPAGAAPLHAPAGPLVQSIVALVRNALDASGPDDRVVVALAHDASDVRITVEDRGAGIPEDVLAHVGEPFFTTKQPGRGLGLGVFLARAFFESRGGALVIESTPGVGTRARARLPAGAPGAA